MNVLSLSLGKSSGLISFMKKHISLPEELSVVPDVVLARKRMAEEMEGNGIYA